MNRDNLKLWIDALESDKYKQGKGVLANKGNDTFCCLGVLCEVAIEHGAEVVREDKQTSVHSSATVVVGYNGEDGLPPNAVAAWLGFDAGDIVIKVRDLLNYLPWHNDFGGATFKDIAAGLRETYLSVKVQDE